MFHIEWLDQKRAGEIQNLKLKASVKERPAKHAKDVFHVEFEHDPTTVLNLLGHFDYRVITSIIDPNTNLISWTMERPMYLYQNWKKWENKNWL